MVVWRFGGTGGVGDLERWFFFQQRRKKRIGEGKSGLENGVVGLSRWYIYSTEEVRNDRFVARCPSTVSGFSCRSRGCVGVRAHAQLQVIESVSLRSKAAGWRDKLQAAESRG